MKMPTSAELGGIHPRSEQLIELTRSYDRGKTERASVEKQIELDTIELVKLQDESGFENFTDGAFSWQDQFRPVVESLDGITTGTRYSRWFDTNTFYKKPTVNGKIGLALFDTKLRYSRISSNFQSTESDSTYSKPTIHDPRSRPRRRSLWASWTHANRILRTRGG